MTEKNKKIIYWCVLLAILCSAFFLRAHNIEKLPSGIYPDEAVNGTDALGSLESGNFKIFYTNNYGREGLFINLQALTIKLFGNNIIGLKSWSIAFGTLTVLGVFLLAREIFSSFRMGLIASFFTAFSFWSINFSRIGFRAVMVPFLLTFIFFFIFRGLRTGHLFNFILAGIFFGLGFHTYVAYRIAPAILLILLIALILSRKNFLKENWKAIAVFSVAFLIALSPMLYDFWKYPEHFSSRTGSISVFSPEINKGNLAGLLAKTISLSLVKYNFWGDQNWRHNFPPYPILNPAAGIFFLAGLIYIAVKFFHLLRLRLKKKVRDEKFPVYALLLGWFFIMLVPEFLTEEGLPHALRSIGTLPVVFIIAAIPVNWLIGKSENAGIMFRVSALSVIFFCLAFVAVVEPLKYFVPWARSPEQHGQFNENYKNMAYYILSLPPAVNKYVYANGSGRDMEDGLPVSAHVIKFLTYNKSENLFFLKKNSDIIPDEPFSMVLMAFDQEFIDKVKVKYPASIVEKKFEKTGYPVDFTVIRSQ